MDSSYKELIVGCFDYCSCRIQLPYMHTKCHFFPGVVTQAQVDRQLDNVQYFPLTDLALGRFLFASD